MEKITLNDCATVDDAPTGDGSWQPRKKRELGELVLQHVIKMIETHEAENGKRPTSVNIPSADYDALERYIKDMNPDEPLYGFRVPGVFVNGVRVTKGNML